jgi:hypothetical protein
MLTDCVARKPADAMSSKRLAARGLVVLAVLAGAPSAIAGGPVATPASASPECNYPTHYNTIICPRSRSEASRYCIRAAEYSAPNSPFIDHRGGTPGSPRTGYAVGSTARYTVAFYASDITGCSPVGNRRISYFQELRNGSQGVFRPNSRVLTTVTNSAFNVNSALTAPYNCTTDAAGSSVRLSVRITWTAKPGWGKDAVRTFHSKSQIVCP